MKRVLNLVKRIFVYAVAVLAICIMMFTILSVSTFNKHNRKLFGYRAYIVLSDSMSKTDFDAGDLVLVKEVKDFSALKEGDIIAYISQNTENYGETVTHKIRSITVDVNGEPGFITYGTTTGTDDETIVTYPFVLGKYETHIPKIGTFFQFLKTPQGYIVCILIPFMLLIIYQGLNCIRLFRRYRKEQTEALQEERNQIEAERLENKKMLEELQALKAKLEKQNSATEADDAPEETGEGDEA